MGLVYRFPGVPKIIFGDKTFKDNVTVEGTHIIKNTQTLTGDTQIGDALTDAVDIRGTIKNLLAGEPVTVADDVKLSGYELKEVKHLMRKTSITGVVPSATANEYGTAVDIEPLPGYYGLAPLLFIALTAGGTFGAETLTVRITATFSDGTTASITKDFTATGRQSLTADEIEDLMKDGVAIRKLSVDCKSTIASSSATGGADIAALNT